MTLRLMYQQITLDIKNHEVTNSDTPDLSDYSLVQDRIVRVPKPILRYGHVDLIPYALQISEEIDIAEQKNYKEALHLKEAMNK